MSFANVRIAKKLIMAFAGVIVIVTAMSATVFGSLTSIETATVANRQSYEAIGAANQALAQLVEQQNAVRGFVASGDEQFPQKFKDRGVDFAKELDALAALSELPEDQARVQQLKVLATKAQSEEQEQIDGRRNPATIAAIQGSIATRGRLTDVRVVMQQITDAARARLQERGTEQEKAFGLARTLLLAGAAAAFGLALLLGWLLTRTIATPVTSMTRVMKSLACGDNAITVPGIGRKDEIGDMAAAVQVVKDNSLALAAAANEKDYLVPSAAAERRRAEAQVIAEERAKVVSSVGQGMAELAKGNLMYRMPDGMPVEYSALQTDFNGAIEKLQQTMLSISGNVRAIALGSVDIASAAADLSGRTEQQAMSLEETATSLDEITATVRKAAEGAKHTRAVVATAKTDAEASGQIVRRAMEAMAGIEGSARQISQIIGVIDEIAFQTNLLALNAGVEAARAGEAGRGFAVVASEVRALAQRSAEAAKEIKTLISTSTAQVDKGVELVGQTGKSLERIVAEVANINVEFAAMTASAQEQATALQQVNTAINQMDKVTQQNAAMVEETTAAAGSLSQKTDELGRLIDRFQCASADAGRRTPAKALHAARPTSRSSTGGRAA
jgi:methyl-accepting chemotaxis protein